MVEFKFTPTLLGGFLISLAGIFGTTAMVWKWPDISSEFLWLVTAAWLGVMILFMYFRYAKDRLL